MMIPMTRRKTAETEVPMMPPTDLKVPKWRCSATAVAATAIVASATTVECPSEKKKPAVRPLALLHQSSNDIVDGSDVVGINCMAQAKHIRKQRGSKERGLITELGERPHPGR